MTIPAPFLQSRFHQVLVPLLMAGSLVPIWSSAYFPSQNGPWHLLIIQMLHEYSNPAFNYSDFYVPSLHAIPHLAHTLLVYVLAFVFPVLVAHQIAISLYALLLPVSVFWFLATVDSNRIALGYTSFLLIYNVPLFRGYHDYVLGIPLVLLTLTYWLRHRNQMTIGASVVTMALIVCVYLSHIFNFLMLGLAMLVYVLYETRTLRALARLAVLFVPATLLLGDFVVFSLRQTQWMDTNELTWLAPHAAVEGFIRNYFYSLSLTGYALAAGALGLVVVIASAQNWRRSDGIRDCLRRIVAKPAGTVFLLCLALYFVTPFKLFGWHLVNVRFVPYVIVFGLAAFSLSGRWQRRTAVATIAAASFVSFGVMAQRIADAGALHDEYLSALPKVRRNSVVLPLAVESADVGEIATLAHAYDYYPLFLGGANGKGIAKFNTVTPLVYRTYPTTDLFPNWDPDRPSDPRRISRTYDYVLQWGSDPFVKYGLRDFELIHEQGRLRLYENRLRKPRVEATRHE